MWDGCSRLKFARTEHRPAVVILDMFVREGFFAEEYSGSYAAAHRKGRPQ
jgi:hypothetical protein